MPPNPRCTDGSAQLIASLLQEAEVQGVQPHSQKFWFGENPGKISNNILKLPENLSKNGVQHGLIWK